MYRPSTGQWLVHNQPTVQFGDAGDRPVPADYNRDGVVDVAVYRPSTGMWFVRNQFAVQFGDPADIPVPADYNGDGRADIAVYRPSTGTWYVRNLLAVQFGDAGRHSRAGRLQRRRHHRPRGVSTVNGRMVRPQPARRAVRRSRRRARSRRLRRRRKDGPGGVPALDDDVDGAQSVQRVVRKRLTTSSCRLTTTVTGQRIWPSIARPRAHGTSETSSRCDSATAGDEPLVRRPGTFYKDGIRAAIARAGSEPFDSLHSPLQTRPFVVYLSLPAHLTRVLPLSTNSFARRISVCALVAGALGLHVPSSTRLTRSSRTTHYRPRRRSAAARRVCRTYPRQGTSITTRSRFPARSTCGLIWQSPTRWTARLTLYNADGQPSLVARRLRRRRRRTARPDACRGRVLHPRQRVPPR